MTPHNPMTRARRLIPAAVAFAALLGVAIHLQAADHKDSPAANESNLDITDLYAFAQGDSMVFIMNVSPFLSPGAATQGATFNPRGLYQFKLDRERDGVEEAVIQVSFSGTDTEQTYSVRGPVEPSEKGTAANMVVGDPVATGKLNQVISGEGVTAFAGPREDPFFLHLLGDSSLTSVLNAAYSAALDTLVGAADQQSLAFSRPGTDDFAGTNVLSIVVRVPKAMLASRLGIADTATFHVWATTSLED